MIRTQQAKPTTSVVRNRRVKRFICELTVDSVTTAAIVWGLVLLGEPLAHVLTSPLFIVLTTAGLARLGQKTFRVEARPSNV